MSNSGSLATQEIPNVGSRTIAVLLSDKAHFALRIALMSVFIYHGIGKFADVGAFAAMMKLPFAIALLVAVAEFGGGLLLLAGAFTRDWVTRIGAAMFVPVMLGAVMMLHWPQWSFVPSPSHPMGGMEFQAVLLLISLYFVMRGNKA